MIKVTKQDLLLLVLKFVVSSIVFVRAGLFTPVICVVLHVHCISPSK